MMNRAQFAIIPAAILGSFVVVVLGSWVSSMMSVPGSWLQPVQPVVEPQTLPMPAGEEIEVEAKMIQPDPVVESYADPGCAISDSYPSVVNQWCSLITRYSQETGLDPNLVAAVMLRESAGDPQAYSKSGAVGLMQIMPRDGLAAKFNCVNGPCFASRPSIDELEDPEYNVAYGARLLAELLEKTGDIREALKSYGPINVGYDYADYILQTYNGYR